MLFSTLSNFWELVIFSLCGLSFGVAFALINSAKLRQNTATTALCTLFFGAFACTVVALSTNIPFYQMGYQTFLVPLSTFYLAYSASQ